MPFIRVHGYPYIKAVSHSTYYTSHPKSDTRNWCLSSVELWMQFFYIFRFKALYVTDIVHRDLTSSMFKQFIFMHGSVVFKKQKWEKNSFKKLYFYLPLRTAWKAMLRHQPLKPGSRPLPLDCSLHGVLVSLQTSSQDHCLHQWMLDVHLAIDALWDMPTIALVTQYNCLSFSQSEENNTY